MQEKTKKTKAQENPSRKIGVVRELHCAEGCGLIQTPPRVASGAAIGAKLGLTTPKKSPPWVRLGGQVWRRTPKLPRKGRSRGLQKTIRQDDPRLDESSFAILLTTTSVLTNRLQASPVNSAIDEHKESATKVSGREEGRAEPNKAWDVKCTPHLSTPPAILPPTPKVLNPGLNPGRKACECTKTFARHSRNIHPGLRPESRPVLRKPLGKGPQGRGLWGEVSGEKPLRRGLWGKASMP